MLKTIKTTKQFRLDELIKYVWENDITDEKYESSTKTYKSVSFRDDNYMSNNGYVIGKGDLFTVEVEEEITEDTKFDTLVSVYPPLGYNLDSFVDVYTNQTINGVISDDKTVGVETECIYTIINGKLELIWERDRL